jgi:hypothetical protein
MGIPVLNYPGAVSTGPAARRSARSAYPLQHDLTGAGDPERLVRPL